MKHDLFLSGKSSLAKQKRMHWVVYQLLKEVNWKDDYLNMSRMLDPIGSSLLNYFGSEGEIQEP